ncbi:hypothetical protein H6F46_08290 [Limnothrix sp. FACHB-1083]|uniref:hypothetical protein n=1 Tax=unclassified Limnothrix TaxID=2632864 RepID=UPI00168073F9|nr:MULTISPECIES: hypothetical protein [unclassified Limnothrix]MBD2160692.1 hypothetical protein [Limnothrix sp. FACHB-1083]MBD2191465.1 hypothetical protein [Limnothrix sp. FACHB-1088]
MVDLYSHAPRIERHSTDRGWSVNAAWVAVHGRLGATIIDGRACSHAPYGYPWLFLARSLGVDLSLGRS